MTTRRSHGRITVASRLKELSDDEIVRKIMAVMERNDKAGRRLGPSFAQQLGYPKHLVDRAF